MYLPKTIHVAVACACALTFGLRSSPASEPGKTTDPLRVTLMDGTTLIVEADPNTNSEMLVVRFTAPGILLRRSILWEHVASGTFHGNIYSAAELQRELTEVALAPAVDPLEHQRRLAAQIGRGRQTGETVATAVTSHVYTLTPPAQQPDQARPQSLQIFAQVANWDRDAAVDGIRLMVRPLDRAGNVVPVDGHLTVKLFGLAFQPAGAIRGTRPLDEFPELATANQQVRREDFGPEGAVYHIEFRKPNPEFRLNVSAWGLTTARLSVPRVGVFEASDAQTNVRPYSAYRDWHQQQTGSRFLPAERVRPNM